MIVVVVVIVIIIKVVEKKIGADRWVLIRGQILSLVDSRTRRREQSPLLF